MVPGLKLAGRHITSMSSPMKMDGLSKEREIKNTLRHINIRMTRSTELEILLKIMAHRLSFIEKTVLSGTGSVINSTCSIINGQQSLIKIRSLPHLYEVIPSNERIIVDVLRQIVKENLPADYKEKISFNVPYFYGNRGICIIWPAGIPKGGFKKGVLLGFWYGNKLQDIDNYLSHGSNKKIFYRIFNTAEEIHEPSIVKLLKEAVSLDELSSNGQKR